MPACRRRPFSRGVEFGTEHRVLKLTGVTFPSGGCGEGLLRSGGLRGRRTGLNGREDSGAAGRVSQKRAGSRIPGPGRGRGLSGSGAAGAAPTVWARVLLVQEDLTWLGAEVGKGFKQEKRS